PLVRADPLHGIYPPGCLAPVSYGITSNEARCRYDYASQIDILPQTETLAFLTRATFQLNADTQLFGEYSIAKQKSIFRISQTPASEATTHLDPATGLTAPLLYPAGGPYYPGNGITPAIPGVALAGDLDIYYRTVELGPRTNQVKTT